MSIESKIYSLASELKYYKQTCIGRNYFSCPFDHFNLIKAEEDGSDTDLYHCMMGADDNVSILRYNVMTNPKTDVIVEIDLTSVDFVVEGIIYDCINVEDRHKLDEFVDKITTLKEKENMTRTYEVSVPYIVTPYVKVVAKDSKEAMQKGLEIINASINNTFDKVDIAPYLVMGKEDIRVELIPTEKEKAIKYLKEYTEISTDLLRDAYVSETKIYNGHTIDLVYLDFNYDLLDGNLCYLRIDGENIYLADETNGYPSTIREALTYAWSDGKESFYFDSNFGRHYFSPNGSLYDRLVELNSLLDYRGVVLIEHNDTEIKVRTNDDDEDTMYVFTYKNDKDIVPIKGVKIETLSL